MKKMKVLKLSSQSPESNLITMLWEFKQDVHTEKPSHSLLQKVPQPVIRFRTQFVFHTNPDRLG